MKKSMAELLRQGDPDTIKALYKGKTGKKIKAFVSQKGGNQDNAESVLSDSVLRIIKLIHQGKYKEEGKIDAFFFQIGKWVWREELKRKKNNKIKVVCELDESMEYNLGHLDIPKNLSENIEQLTTDAHIQRFLNKNEKCKRIFQLRYVEGYSLVEIQEKHGIKHANVNCKRCLDRLRKHIESQTNRK